VSASTSSGRFPDFRLAPSAADYSGGTVADFHGLPLTFRIVPRTPRKVCPPSQLSCHRRVYAPRLSLSIEWELPGF
jgi:alkylated DNA nucleotide flippase Atl1